MRRFLLAALVLPAAAGASAAERAALVIGAEDYEANPPEPGARAVAEDAAERLAAAGYEVEIALDPGRAALRRSLGDFAEISADAERAVVVYVGRAADFGGATWLAPVNIEPDDALEFSRTAVPLAAPLGLAAPEGTVVAVVDASASGAFADLTGVEPGVAPAAGAGAPIVLSATAPGAEGGEVDPGFVETALDLLLSEQETLGEALDALERARPDAYVGGDVDAASDVALNPGAPETSGAIEREVELELWRAAERSGEAADYRAYLDRYPEGVFAPIARNRLDAESAEDAAAQPPAPQQPAAPEQSAAEAAAEAAERALDLDREERRLIQRELTARGYDTRGVDGIFGPGTRSAVRAFQQAQGRETTGYLTEQGAQTLLTAARERIEAEEAAAVAAARDAESDLNLSRSDRVGAQEALTDRGYDTGGTAGVFGPEMRRAIRRFQETRNEPVTGYLTAEQVSALTSPEAAPTPSPAQPAPSASPEPQLWSEAQTADTLESYARYLEAYPEGPNAAAARARLAALQSAAAARAGRGDPAPAQPADPETSPDEAAAAAESALGLDQNSRAAVEARLRQAGYDPGAADGAFTEETRSAIRSFQSAQGLPANGYLDRGTVTALVNTTSAQTITPEELIGGAVRNVLEQIGR